MPGGKGAARQARGPLQVTSSAAVVSQLATAFGQANACQGRFGRALEAIRDGKGFERPLSGTFETSGGQVQVGGAGQGVHQPVFGVRVAQRFEGQFDVCFRFDLAEGEADQMGEHLGER